MPKLAYDEEYSRLTPGLLLFKQTLERCCKDNEIRRLNFLTSPAWMNVWQPDLLAMEQAHLAIGRWSGRPLIAMLRFRFGRGREMAHWLRRKLKPGAEEGPGGKGRGNRSEGSTLMIPCSPMAGSAAMTAPSRPLAAMPPG